MSPTNDLDVGKTVDRCSKNFLEDFPWLAMVVVSPTVTSSIRTIDRLFWVRGRPGSSALRANYSAYLAQAGPATSAGDLQTGGREPPRQPAGARQQAPGKAPGNSLGGRQWKQGGWCGRRAGGAAFSENRELVSELEAQLPRLEAQRSQLEQQLLAGAERDYGQLGNSLTQELLAWRSAFTAPRKRFGLTQSTCGLGSAPPTKLAQGWRPPRWVKPT